MKIFIDYERASIFWVLNSSEHKQWQYPSLNIAHFCSGFCFGWKCRSRKNYARTVFSAALSTTRSGVSSLLASIIKLIENKSFILRSEHFKLQHICVKMIALISLKYLETRTSAIEQNKAREPPLMHYRHCIMPNSKWISHWVWEKRLDCFFYFGSCSGNKYVNKFNKR